MNARLFAVVWGLAMWVHLWNHDIPGELALRADVIAGWAVNLAAMALVLSRGSGRALCVAAVAQITHASLTMPEVADHWLLVGSVNAMLLASAVWKRSFDPEVLLQACAPSARVVALLAYGAAAVSKLNWHFVDPDVSCAIYLARIQEQFVPLGADIEALQPLHIYGTMLAEMSIPILLLFPRTRRIGITLGIVFHFLISFTPAVKVFDFTATLFALWVLFAPPDTASRMGWLRDRVLQRYTEVAPYAGTAATGLGVVLGAFTLVHTALPVAMNLAMRTLVFDLYGLFWLTVGVWAIWTAPRSPAQSLRPHLLFAPVLAIMLVNVMAPYIGLKSVSSFTMFSNLRTERGQSNHFFLPSVAIFPYLSDAATVQSSSDRIFKEVAEHQEWIPFHELSRRSHLHGADQSLSWKYQGQSLHTARAGDEPALDSPWWQRTFLVSRPFPESGAGRCQN